MAAEVRHDAERQEAKLAAATIVAAQLAWIAGCAVQSPVQAGLMLQSAALLAMVQSRTPGATFVPELSRTVYADTARARTDLAFAPAVTLEQGLRAQFQWMTEAGLFNA